MRLSNIGPTPAGWPMIPVDSLEYAPEELAAMRAAREEYDRAKHEAARSEGCCKVCGTIMEREVCPRCKMADAFGVSA